jgi:hypothetical protein
MKKAAEILSVIFGWGVYICLFAGGLATFAYILALILGGGAGEAGYTLARFIQRNYFPFIVRIVSASVMIGLIAMYLSGQKALSLVTDKEAANEEIAQSRKQEQASAK